MNTADERPIDGVRAPDPNKAPSTEIGAQLKALNRCLSVGLMAIAWALADGGLQEPILGTLFLLTFFGGLLEIWNEVEKEQRERGARDGDGTP